MTNASQKAAGWGSARQLRGVLVFLVGCLALAAPFFAGQLTIAVVGLLLILCGILQMYAIFRAADDVNRYVAYFSGSLSIVVGVLLLNRPGTILTTLTQVVGWFFVIDGIVRVFAALKARGSADAKAGHWLVGLAILGLGLALAMDWPFPGLAMVEIFIGFRMVTFGLAMALSRDERRRPQAEMPLAAAHPDRRLKLPAHPEFAALEKSLSVEELGRRSIDAYWCGIFVVLFFAIHLGRMGVEWNLVGMVSPLAAVAGDIGTSLVLAFGIILPTRLAWRKMTRFLERRGWRRILARLDQQGNLGWIDRCNRRWLIERMRYDRIMTQIRRSPRAALRWGLQVGLPATAILIAVNPIWGFSWFFNSESWATEIWNRWAEARTDQWRANMIVALREHYQAKNVLEQELFAVHPEGVGGGVDFSFLVLGDTGEGGPAQHSLRDQYLMLSQRPDVKFVVISSDVIYPSGAMMDYESKFYLPFKGVTQPIYAIPGNHDWYDALEGFAANFMEPDAARVCMLSRVETDNRLTSTTQRRIDRYIEEAARLRKEFGVKTGLQRGPFFEVATKQFALIAVDTGVLKTVDSEQWQWFKSALQRARGKFTMVILGHPLYAGGRYQGGAEGGKSGEWAGSSTSLLSGGSQESFLEVHRLLREYEVPVVMAGDTHYFEHYREKYQSGKTMLHFVNGGGGAYMSIGTPLDWPRQPAVPDCTYFPRKDAVITKLNRETPTWKMPLWFWAKDLGGWPLSAEALAGAFDYSKAPYFQSFVEIRVEGSAKRVRIIPYGANGRLRWRDLDTFGAVLPPENTASDLVEFIGPMQAAVPAKQ